MLVEEILLCYNVCYLEEAYHLCSALVFSCKLNSPITLSLATDYLGAKRAQKGKPSHHFLTHLVLTCKIFLVYFLLLSYHCFLI